MVKPWACIYVNWIPLWGIASQLNVEWLQCLRQGSPRDWIYEIVNGPACGLLSTNMRGDNQALWLWSKILLGGERGGGGSLKISEPKMEHVHLIRTDEVMRQKREWGCYVQSPPIARFWSGESSRKMTCMFCITS